MAQVVIPAHASVIVRLTVGGHLSGSTANPPPTLRRVASHASTSSAVSHVTRVSSSGSLAQHGLGSPTAGGGGDGGSGGRVGDGDGGLPLVPHQSFAQLDAELSVEYNMSMHVPPRTFHMRAFIGCPLEFPVTHPL